MRRNLHAGRRRSGGLHLDVFTADEVEDIHLSSLEVLERTGVFVEDDEPLDIYADGGCRVDRERHMVHIPPHVVHEAIQSAPPKVYLCGRDPRNDIVLEAGRVSFCNFDEGIMVVDLETGEHRSPTKADVADIARLVDALGDIDTYESAVGAGDVPPETQCLHNTEAALNNTSKCVGSEAVSAWDVRKIVEMAALVVGGVDELRERPIVGFGVCPVSPLKLPRDATEVIIETARLGLPDTVLSMAMAGGSSPVTLAGTLVTHNAEVLAGITLAQLTERGCPVVYGSSTTAMDLRLAAAAVGCPELALISAGAAQLARQYRLPSYIAGA
jgi:trimethylamine--corrinoid protein Co-methyltransferase